jgi:ankyrin repeat protein
MTRFLGRFATCCVTCLLLASACLSNTSTQLGSTNSLNAFVAANQSPSYHESLKNRDPDALLIPGYGFLAHAAAFGYLDLVSTFAADPSLRGAEGPLAMYTAASLDRVDVVKALINHGVDPNAEIESKLTPIFAAAEFGHTRSLCLLILSGARINHRSSTSYTLLELAAGERRVEIVRVLLEVGYEPTEMERLRVQRIAERNGTAEISSYLSSNKPQPKTVEQACSTIAESSIQPSTGEKTHH